MKIESDDYEVINRYAGSDRSWHDRVSTRAGVEKVLAFSATIISSAIVAARYESRCVPRQGDNHG
ncbi:TPA: hypothetical protein ACSTL5_004927 [Serratia fonticola]